MAEIHNETLNVHKERGWKKGRKVRQRMRRVEDTNCIQ